MRRLTRFWNTLDALPDAATDQRDWVRRLGDDWASAALLLRRTGRFVEAVDCPSPGGENCPRRVVRLPNGRFRAVCGERPAVCDSLDLTRDEVAILALDVAKLAAVIVKALAVSGTPDHFGRGPVIHLGRHDIFVGRGIPVYLVLAGPLLSDSAEPFRAIAEAEPPKLGLVPTSGSLSAAQRRHLSEVGATLLALDDILVADARHFIVASRPVDELLAALRTEIEGAAGADLPTRAWDLPPDARWEEMVFEFTAAEVINVSFRGETRRFEPEHLGMKNAKSGRPTLQWTLLQTLAATGGRISWQDPGAASRVEKQKQGLKNKLVAAFGIGTDAIPWKKAEGAYVALFTIRGDVLDHGRPGQRRR